jgi:hypothetical protein
LRVSVGSLAEVGYGFHLAKRIGHLKDAEFEELLQQMRKTAAPLLGLLKKSEEHMRREKKLPVTRVRGN